MKAPLSWLNDFVKIDISPEDLAQKLLQIGFEVEEIEYQNSRAQGVVVCKIISVDKHPNADRLSVCQVKAGEKTLQIVTNVKVAAGEYIPVALDGARLFDGKVIRAGELRGVKSDGMFCGGAELGVTAEEYSGASNDDVLRLKGEFETGENIFDAIGLNDVILDVSITANRPDCNAIYKLAKEIAVVLNVPCYAPALDYSEIQKRTYDMVSVEVLNQTLCPRYIAAGVSNAKIAQSPEIIKKRLRTVGIRPINNIVDITNYVLIELGQPMHAFDRRDLTGAKIVVRTARSDESIVTLDGKNNALTENMLVICDQNKPVAVAGIMGGENSGIKEDTTEIILESARFARESVRRTSRALNLRSDSSARFEKGVDFPLQQLAVKRALHLIQKYGGGDAVQGIIDICVPVCEARKISFSKDRISKILGLEVPKQTLVSVLEPIGIKIEESGDTLTATVPADREDIAGVNDIAEEFIRMYGFDRVPRTVFSDAPMPKNGGGNEEFAFVREVKNIMNSLGANEIINYSFTTPKYFDLLRLPADDELRTAVTLMNPLGEAVSVMRTTLLHSMLETIRYNITKFNAEARFFEVGRVYKPKSLPLTELPEEEIMLSVGLYGENEDFFSLKAVVDALLDRLNVAHKFKKHTHSALHDGRSAAVLGADGQLIGVLGEAHPDILNNYNVAQRLYIAELSLKTVWELCRGNRRFAEISRYPSVERDLAVIVDGGVPVQDLVDCVLDANIKNLSKCRVFDVYCGEAVGAGKKSVALNFEFSSLERTLTDEEIKSAMDEILAVLEGKFGAKLRL